MKPTLIALAVVGIACSCASAQSLYQSGGFESPRFAPGTIDGQDSGAWSVDPAAQGNHLVVSGTTLGANPFSGTQMVRLNGPSTNFSWPDITAGVAGRTAGNDVIVTSTRIFIPLASELAAGANGVFGILAYNAAASNMGGIRVRVSDGAIFGTIDPDGAGPTAFGNYTFGAGGILARGQWHEIGFGLNIVTRAMTLLVNGATLFTGTTSQTVALNLTDVDFISSLVSGAQPASVLVDDYSVVAVAVVPSPAAAALLGLGGLAAFRRRR